MAKNEKPAPATNQSKGSGKDADAPEGAKPKGKKPLLIAIGVLVLGIAGGAGWYLTKGNSSPADTAKKAPAAKLEQPKFIPLDAFTVNLQREEGDQFLQVGITLKITDPTLEEKIKLVMPEIRSRLLLLLSGKRASELAPVSGKKKLAQEIILEVDSALGLHPATPGMPKAQPAGGAGAVSGVIAPAHAASGVAVQPGAASAPAAEPATEEAPATEEEPEAEEKNGITDVLFTSFIIQ
ncbi:MAG: flagellar basal body-associated FliL family protein [Nitrosomonadales bacterium]|nr:flagellar basal body-associated FliL family protein [Nitrosomonadales bacterium]